MSKNVWTLPAVLIGGVLTRGGSVAANHLKSLRNQQHAKKERLRENLYTILDDL